MQGVNNVTISGNVKTVTHTTTNLKSDPVCTFIVCSDSEDNYTTLIKVSAYDDKALKCKILDRGDYVIVEGRLSNRKVRGGERMELEVKATGHIVIEKKRNQETISDVEQFEEQSQA